MEEVRCPMCSKPNPIDAEVCEFCSARIKPLIIQQEPEEKSQPKQPPPQDQSEQPEDQPRAETDWLSRMRYGAEDGDVSDQDLEDDPSVPKRGETDLLGRFRDLGISDDAQESLAQEGLVGIEAGTDVPEDWLDVEEPFDVRERLSIPDKDIDIRERLLVPEEDIDIEEQLSVPDEDIDIAKRLSFADHGIDIKEEFAAPDEDIAIEESLPDPDLDIETKERRSLLDQEIDFEQIFSIGDKGFESDLALPESAQERVTEQSSLEDVLQDIISDDPRSKQEQDAEVVPDWLARIRVRKETDEESAPPRTGDTDWLTGLREVSLTDDKSEQDTLPPEGEISPYEPIDEDLAPLQLEETLDKDLEEEEDWDASLTSVEDLISELDTLSKGDAEEDIQEDLSLEEPITLDYQRSSIEDLIAELDELASDDATLEPDQAASLDFETSSPEKEDGLELEDFFRDFGQPSEAPEEVKIDDEIFKDLVSAEEKSKEQIIPEDLFADFLGLPSKKDEAELMGDVLGDAQEARAEGEDAILGDDFFANLGLDVSASEEIPLEDESVEVFPELSDGGLPIDSTYQTDEMSPARRIEPTDDNFLADLIDDSSEFKDFDFAPGSDVLAKDPDFDDLRELSADLPAGSPFDTGPREKSPLSDILSDFSPSWMDGTFSAEEGKLPDVPALILDDELPPIEGVDAEGEAVSIEIPSWLQDLGKDVEEELDVDDGDLPVLAKATLPPWLEAMRPLETFRAPPEIELEEEEEIVEAAGPLAGLRGVLLAEPVVAMPRTSVVSVGTLAISDRDYSQTEILQRMVEEEESEEEGIVTKGISFPLIRWITAALLVLGVTFPTIFGFPNFRSPTRAPRELSPFLEIIRTLPADKPVLMVFDYDPSHSAEMDAVAGALVENLMAQDQPIITLSTQPSGPLLADRMLRRVGNVHDAKNGEDYLHLGYLSGGPIAIRLFVASPADSLVRGFKLPEEFESQNAWDSPLLANTRQFSDFAMVAVISSGTETARNWAEQVRPLMGNSSLVMVLSAGTEPIIRPYYETDGRQIDGILSGLPSAVIYEGVNGLQADATQRWNGYGSSVLISVMLLLTGAGIGVVTWLIKRFGSRES